MKIFDQNKPDRTSMKTQLEISNINPANIFENERESRKKTKKLERIETRIEIEEYSGLTGQLSLWDLV